MVAMVKSHHAARMEDCHRPALAISWVKILRHTFLGLVVFTICLAHAIAETPKGTATPEQLALIDRATEYQLQSLKNPTPYEFQERLEWNWGTETRSVIETPQGRADRIIFFRDEPLTPEQQEKQEHRLQKLLSDHDAVKSEMQDQKAETQRRIRMVQAFPAAFYFDYVGQKKDVLQFNFRPNPDFSPKDRETQMYRGMEGSLWINEAQERMVQVKGKLTKDVSFGWGVFGRLYKGGIYEISQTELAPGQWRITQLNVDVKGRILFFDTFRFLRKETDTHLHPTPESITYQAAVTTLLKSDDTANKQKPAVPSLPTHAHAHQGSGH